MSARVGAPLAALARQSASARRQRAAVMDERRELLRAVVDPYRHVAPPGSAEDAAAEGAFAGISACVADAMDVAGMPTKLGLAEGNTDDFPFTALPAARDAPIVDWFKRHGGSVTGKTAVAPFHMKAPLDRPLRNPWSLEYGSGSGAATAVGLGLADVGLAVQTAGEINLFSARAGVVGYKSTFGTFAGSHSFAACPDDRAFGFFTRSVADARFLAKAVEPGTVTGQYDAGDEAAAGGGAWNDSVDTTRFGQSSAIEFVDAIGAPEAQGGAPLALEEGQRMLTEAAEDAPEQQTKKKKKKKKKAKKGKTKDLMAPPAEAVAPVPAGAANALTGRHRGEMVPEETWASGGGIRGKSIKDEVDEGYLALVGGRGGDWVGGADDEAAIDAELDAPGRVLRVGAAREWGGYSSTAQWEVESAVDALLGSEKFCVVDVKHKMFLSDLYAVTENWKGRSNACLVRSLKFWHREGRDGHLQERAWPTPVADVVRRRFGASFKGHTYGWEHPHEGLRWTRFIHMLLTDAKLDALMTPVAPGPAARPSGIDAQHEFGIVFSVTGSPTVTLPLGRCCPQTGVPLGVQLIGRRNEDRRLLAVAERVEAQLREKADGEYAPLWDIEPIDVLGRAARVPVKTP